MNLKTFLVISSAIFGHCYATGDKWDGLKGAIWYALKVKFGTFTDLPRTVDDALSKNFTKISDCSLSDPWRGNRYIANNDRSVILLFDVSGYIAGIQMSIPKNLPSGYPPLSLQPPFVSDGDFWVTTAYFVYPGKICTPGRSQNDVDTYGTGRSLYLQNSTSPKESTRIPKLSKKLAGTSWTKGKCFPAMGTHYWWNISGTSACDALAPWFLLYNGGRLSAFGFAFATNLTASIFERPRRDMYQLFMDPVPQCLLTDGVINTLHVYLTSNASQITCNGASPTTGG